MLLLHYSTLKYTSVQGVNIGVSLLTNGHPQAYAKRYPLGPSFYGGVRVTKQHRIS